MSRVTYKGHGYTIRVTTDGGPPGAVDILAKRLNGLKNLEGDGIEVEKTEEVE